jgi:hypothetical protein
MSIRMYTLTDENGKEHQVSQGIYDMILRAGGIDEVMADGSTVRVPITLRDGQPFQPAPRPNPDIRNDADPRFAAVTDAQRQAIEDARQEYIERISNQWRQDRGSILDPPVADSRTPNLSTRTPVLQPPPRQPIVNDEREAAYADYLDYLTNAWHREKAT